MPSQSFWLYQGDTLANLVFYAQSTVTVISTNQLLGEQNTSYNRVPRNVSVQNSQISRPFLKEKSKDQIRQTAYLLKVNYAAASLLNRNPSAAYL